ncbi:MAG: methyltransferase [Chloroflexi bacterium]|nr:MAG: methyltransferase [Chloroflexota bacterium]
MGVDQWSEMDRYLAGLFAPPDPVLEQALQAGAAAGMPAINVSPVQGKLLYLLARAVRAQRILEIGTLAAYSTIWLARGLEPGGRLVSLEINPEHAAVARANLAKAGLAESVEVRLGSALDSLTELAASSEVAPFDLVFVDADKPSTPDYVSWAIQLTRPGGLIVVDNIVRGGQVSDPATTDENARGIQVALELLSRDPRVIGAALQTVGSKGWDGLAIAVVQGA